MRQSAALFEPIVDVRDVLESFLRDGVLLRNWRRMLTEASGRLAQLATGTADPRLRELGQRIDVLVDTGLHAEHDLTRQVAADVEKMLDEATISGVPRPDDDDWAF